MSQTKIFAADLGNTVRKNVRTLATSGSGNNKRMYVGRSGTTAYDYDAYERFALDWTNVGTIVKAELVVFTDDGQGDMPLTTTETPKLTVKRLTSAFSEHSHSAIFDPDDYTSPLSTTSKQVVAYPTRAANLPTRIVITDIVKAWKSGSTNDGVGLYGTTSTGNNWAGWSEDATDPALRPYIELTYEYGATVPTTPTNLSPSGAVASIGSFQGDFADVRPTDQLRYSEVAVFDAGHALTADYVGTDDVAHCTGHGLANGSIIYFSALSAGTGLTTFTGYYVRDRTANTFKVATTLTGTAVNVTVAYTSGTWTKRVYSVKRAASNTEIVNARFDHVPDSLVLARNTTYRWRARVWDQEGQSSAWTSLTSFSVTNTDPGAPVLAPAAASTYATFDGVQFSGGTFADADTGDTLLAYQVQLSAYPAADAHWLDADNLRWDTGKVYVTSGATSWITPYGGSDLVAGTYYWRARVWDNHDGISLWSTASIILSANFDPAPGDTTSIQLRPRAPWRIVIRDMFQADGTTPTVGRGPGRVVAVLGDAKSVGASLSYNSPGEAHWTLPVDHPQISVIEPKQTHWSLQFYAGDGWRETFAGLVWDADANERDIIFYGIDYLALYDYTMDERYDASAPDKPSESGGSKYVSTGKNSIHYIVQDQLERAKALANSPVGFITVSSGNIATMATTMVVYSTYQATLPFVASLLDSYRSGTGKRTRISVRRTTAGGYEVVVEDDPGIVRDNLRLRYGELVQGYRTFLFGKMWGTRVLGVGRSRDGVRVLYSAKTAPSISEATWGRYAQAQVIDGVDDQNDLARRIQQAATRNGKLGSQMGLGLRSGVLQPLDGYDICDVFPVSIEHGAISTSAMGSGYWAAMAIAWEASDQGQQITTLTFQPREDTVAPDTDLLTLSPINPQDYWQIGWVEPSPLDGPIRDGSIWIRTSDGHILRWDAVLAAWVDLTLSLPGMPRILADGTIVDEDFAGALPGGHNVILNSGFELGNFTAVGTTSTVTWDIAADWSGSHVRAVTNLTEGGSLTITAGTY